MGETKKSMSQKLYDFFSYADIFGEEVKFNVNGEETYKTICGSFVTVAIYVWCVLFFIDGTKEFLDREKVPQINSMYKYNEFAPTEPVTFEEWEFYFAFGVASGHNLAKFEPIDKYGEIQLMYRKSNSDEDDTTKLIEIEKC